MHGDQQHQTDHPVGAVPRVLQDRQALLAVPATPEAVGDIGESVVMKGPGDQGSRHQRQRRGEPGGEHLVGHGEHPGAGGTDAQSDRGKPGGGPSHVDLAVDVQGDSGEKRPGDPQVSQRAHAGGDPNHSVNVATSVTPRAAWATRETANIAPLPSPSRRPKSSSGLIARWASSRRWPGSAET